MMQAKQIQQKGKSQTTRAGRSPKDFCGNISFKQNTHMSSEPWC